MSQATHPSGLAVTRGAATRAGGVAARAAVVAVGSGKGGVGTSTVAALLAATMAADGHRVLLVDAAQRFGGLHHLLGVQRAGTLQELRGERSPQELLVPLGAHLSLFPAGVEDDVLRPAERQLLTRRVTSLYHDFELVVVDAGSTAESLVTACVDGTSRLLAVTAADRVSLVATYALVKLLHERTPHVRVDVVANRVDGEAANRVHEHLNAACVRFLSRTVPYAGFIPDDPDFGSALAAGLGTDEAALGSTAALAVRSLGERLLSEGRAGPTSHRLLRKV